MIPKGHTIEDIKTREQIIRNFYREWKEKSISCEMLNFCPLCVAEVYALRCDAMCKIHSKQLVHYGYSIFKLCHFVLYQLF